MTERLAFTVAAIGLIFFVVALVMNTKRWRDLKLWLGAVRERNLRWREVSVEDVWRSDAGAHLFNGLTRMRLLDTNERRVSFSQRRALTDQIIELLLDKGYVPSDLTPRIEKKKDRKKGAT